MAKKKTNLTEKKPLRQPIIAVMGHVDHGKTTFLDSIRGTKVAAKEFGGITQNTRAHEVTTKDGFKITFIDTPGHEAFSKMRERGAKVTDFVLLMVAADDGVQPQTKESIEFAHKNNVPIIVAINKIDLPGVNVQKIKTELSNFGVVIEEYGGEVLCFEISAAKQIGLEGLLDGIKLLSEIRELSSNEVKEGSVGEAFVLESSLDKNIGHSALCILKAGNLDDRYFGVTKDSYFKVRAYMNEEGRGVPTVKESQPFVMTGLKDDLATGDIVVFVKTENEAKDYVKKLQSGEIQDENEEEPKDLESLFAQMLIQREEKKQGLTQKELNVVLKCSTQGTLEAAIAQLEELEDEESKVRILSSGTGPVTEEDVNRAKIGRGIVLAFQTDVPRNVEDIARRDRVILRKYEVIYAMIDEVAEVLDSLSEPKEEEIELARAKIKQIFKLSDGSTVAGCEVTKGIFVKGYRIKAVRASTSKNSDEFEEIGQTKIKSLRQGKNEVKEVKKGNDCGIQLEQDIPNLQEGDEIVAFKIEKL